MLKKKKEHPKEKSKLHPRNKHRERYDFKLLTESCPELTKYVRLNEYQDESIDFFDPAAVKALNKALLKQYYNIDNWDIPANYLCPPIPGRADYIHYMADLLYSKSGERKISPEKIKCLDIGIGANSVYPIIGIKEYDWSFIGADIDPVALESVKKIMEDNPFLKEKINLRLQSNTKNIFQGIIRRDEFIDLTICNPPFHASAEDAQAGTMRKLKNLKRGVNIKPTLNFGGQQNELWCEGGEERFVKDMITESKLFPNSCFWYSTLISKSEHLQSVYHALEKVGPFEIKTIPMGQGNKTSRIIAWTFLNREQQDRWMNTRWK